MASVTRQKPYQNPNFPGLHDGVVAVTGSLTVDLGIGHDTYNVIAVINGALADIAPAHIIAVKKSTKKGAFTIQVGKATAAGTTTVIAATAAVNISFYAVERSTVTPG
jgi:hypothetical protein